MITPEKKDEIIDLDYQGKSKEEISEISGVSTGTVFNVVKEHEQEIGKGDRESLRRLAKFADKKKIPFICSFRFEMIVVDRHSISRFIHSFFKLAVAFSILAWSVPK